MNLFLMVIENSVINKSGLNQQVYSSLKNTTFVIPQHFILIVRYCALIVFPAEKVAYPE